MNENINVEEVYKDKGFGRKLGFGQSPAVLVVDFVNAFTDGTSPLGADFGEELKVTREILDTSRAVGIPIIFTTVSYQPNTKDAERLWLKNQPEGAVDFLATGTRWVDIDPKLQRGQNELLITKKYASAFFGTDLSSLLHAQRVDTIIITGCTTSGCVRATAVDGVSYEFRVIVVRDAVGDRSALSHRVSLADLDAKYGDVVSSNSILSYLKSLNSSSKK